MYRTQLPKRKILGNFLYYFETDAPILLHNSYRPYTGPVQPVVFAYRHATIERMHWLRSSIGADRTNDFITYLRYEDVRRARAIPVADILLLKRMKAGLHALSGWRLRRKVELSCIFAFEKAMVGFVQRDRPGTHNFWLVYAYSKKSWYLRSSNTVEHEARVCREIQHGALDFEGFSKINMRDRDWG